MDEAVRDGGQAAVRTLCRNCGHPHHFGSCGFVFEPAGPSNHWRQQQCVCAWDPPSNASPGPLASTPNEWGEG